MLRMLRRPRHSNPKRKRGRSGDKASFDYAVPASPSLTLRTYDAREVAKVLRDFQERSQQLVLRGLMMNRLVQALALFLIGQQFGGHLGAGQGRA